MATSPAKTKPVSAPHTGAAAVADQASSPSLPFAPGVPSRPFTDPHAVAKEAIKGQPPTLADVDAAYAKPAEQSQSNVLGHPTENLQGFLLQDLELFTKEQKYSTSASKDVHLFYVGRDDVHDILKYILSRVSISLYLNMFGFDDTELNNILMEKALNPSITMMITLDQSQAGGVHEKALVEADQKYNLAAFNTHYAIGQSLTHQISHTKGFVADGRVAAEGSTNWSASGEGTFVVQGLAGGPGYKAQNNTQCIITDPDTIVRFQTELITEHMTISSVAHRGEEGYRVSQPMGKDLTPATKAIEAHVRAVTTPTSQGGSAPSAAVPTPTKAAKKRVAKKSV